MSNKTTTLKDWIVSTSDCGQYIYIFRENRPGTIQIKAEDEGFVVDIYDDQDDSTSQATTCCFYADLELSLTNK